MTERTTRLKMLVESVKRSADQTGNIQSEDIALRAVYDDGKGVNKEWSKWTPNGYLSFTISNPNVMNKILPGSFFYIDLIPTTIDG